MMMVLGPFVNDFYLHSIDVDDDYLWMVMRHDRRQGYPDYIMDNDDD